MNRTCWITATHLRFDFFLNFIQPLGFLLHLRNLLFQIIQLLHRRGERKKGQQTYFEKNFVLHTLSSSPSVLALRLPSTDFSSGSSSTSTLRSSSSTTTSSSSCDMTFRLLRRTKRRKSTRRNLFDFDWQKIKESIQQREGHQRMDQHAQSFFCWGKGMSPKNNLLLP